MDALVIVVVDGHGNGFVKLCEVLAPTHVAKLQLEVTEPAFHETVLPGTGALATAERYLHPLT